MKDKALYEVIVEKVPGQAGIARKYRKGGDASKE